MTLVLHPSFRRCFFDDAHRWRYPPGLYGRGYCEGGGIGDDPPELFPYPLPDQHGIARQIARGLEDGLVGEELFDLGFVDVAYDDKGRLDHCRLATFQAVYGNRKGKRKNVKPTPQPTGQLSLG